MAENLLSRQEMLDMIMAEVGTEGGSFIDQEDYERALESERRGKELLEKHTITYSERYPAGFSYIGDLAGHSSMTVSAGYVATSEQVCLAVFNFR